MKNKTTLFVTCFAALLLVTIIGSIIFVILFNGHKPNKRIVEITYSYGGGFGTEIDTASKTLTFTEDGKLTLSNGYDLTVKEINIGKSKYNKLRNYINNNFSIFEEKAREDIGVMDGGSSSLSVKLEDDSVYEISGYMLTNRKYKKIVEKIYEIVDRDTIKEYEKTIGGNKEKILLYTISYDGINCPTPTLYLYSDNTFEYYYTFTTDETQPIPSVGKYDYDINKIIENADKYKEDPAGPYYIKDSKGNITTTYSSNIELKTLLNSIGIKLEMCLEQQ